MRILHLANHARDVGNGIVNVMVDLAVAQAQAGHEVTLATETCGFAPLLQAHGVRHMVLPQRRALALPAGVRGLRRVVDAVAPQIVHAHMVSGALVAWSARCLGARGYGLVTTVHNEFQRSSNLMRLGDRVVAVSGAVGARMAERGIPAARIRVVRNATIGAARLLRQAESPLRLDGPAIVTVSGLYARKGVLDLIEAFAMVHARYPAARLYLVGDGPDRGACERLARERGVAEAVRLVGFVSDPRPWMRAADVFVLASHSESFPLVMAEAREVGCAIVATSVGGVPEALEYGAAGMLVPARRPALLAEALGTLLRDPVTLAVWRTRARAGTEWLRVERMQRDYDAVYDEVLAGLGAMDAEGEASAAGEVGTGKGLVRHG